MTDLDKTMIYACLYLGIALIFLSDFVGFYYHSFVLTVFLLVSGLVAGFSAIVAIAVRRLQRPRAFSNSQRLE
jgi:hypothetical protein